MPKSWTSLEFSAPSLDKNHHPTRDVRHPGSHWLWQPRGFGVIRSLRRFWHGQPWHLTLSVADEIWHWWCSTQLVPVLSGQPYAVHPAWTCAVIERLSDVLCNTGIGPWTDHIHCVHSRPCVSRRTLWTVTPPLRGWHASIWFLFTVLRWLVPDQSEPVHLCCRGMDAVQPTSTRRTSCGSPPTAAYIGCHYGWDDRLGYSSLGHCANWKSTSMPIVFPLTLRLLCRWPSSDGAWRQNFFAAATMLPDCYFFYSYPWNGLSISATLNITFDNDDDQAQIHWT